MTSLFIALEQGSIDAIIWGISITQERLKKVAMIRYQGDTTKAYSLIFWNSIPESVKRINDMLNKTVCVEPTSAQETVLNRYPFIRKFPIEKVDDALLALQYGKADAAFVEPVIAKKFQKRYPEIKILEVPLAQEDQVQGIGIAIKRDNTDSIKHIRSAVTLLQDNGTISNLEKKWCLLC
jgi:ABC-type amino acid transport substrate-binding protein